MIIEKKVAAALIYAMNNCTQALILSLAAKHDEGSKAYKEIVERSAELEKDIDDTVVDLFSP